MLYIFYKVSEDINLKRYNTCLVSQLVQSPGDQLPNGALILYKQQIPEKSSHHLLTFTSAFVGPSDEQCSSVLLTTNKAKQTLPGTVTQGGAET